MESSFRTLQSQLDNSNRKISTTETILKNITQERDSAVSQLGIAYFTIEQLKVENETLKDENKNLKTRLGQLTSGDENETHRWPGKEEALRRKFDRKGEAERSMAGNAVQHPEVQDKSDSKTRHRQGIESNSRSSPHKSRNNMYDLAPSQKNIDEPSQGAQRTVQIDDSQDSEDSVYEASGGNGKAGGKARSPRSVKNAQADETLQNLTYLSFLEVRCLLLV